MHGLTPFSVDCTSDIRDSLTFVALEDDAGPEGFH